MLLFFDRSLATEEEKDMLLRADREKGRGKHNAMREYFAAQHRMGTIAVLTGNAVLIFAIFAGVKFAKNADEYFTESPTNSLHLHLLR